MAESFGYSALSGVAVVGALAIGLYAIKSFIAQLIPR